MTNDISSCSFNYNDSQIVEKDLIVQEPLPSEGFDKNIEQMSEQKEILGILINDMSDGTTKVIDKENNEVKNIFMNYHEGQIILNHLKFSDMLQPSMRNKIALIIITHMSQNSSDQKLTTFELKKVSTELVKLFPNEVEQTYFIPYRKEEKIATPNSGKLWDKYCNMRKYTR